MRLLSVDFDYFFPTRDHDPKQWQLWDWGRNEMFNRTLQDFLWLERAAGFRSAGLDLPKTTGLEKTFWQRFRFAPWARLYVSDSHSQAASEEIMRGVTEVWNYDAHHDAGYNGAESLLKVLNQEQVSCEDWMIAYHMRDSDMPLHVVYPSWRGDIHEEEKPGIAVKRHLDNNLPVAKMFDRVHIALSSSFCPPWVDKDFFEFVAASPVPDPIWMEGSIREPRGWSEEQAAELARIFDQARFEMDVEGIPR
jgi:hypothetical protein